MLSGYLVTVRHALLPVGAALVLGVGVYLFLAVRAQPALPRLAQSETNSPPPARAAAHSVPQPAAPRNASIATPATPPTAPPPTPPPPSPAQPPKDPPPAHEVAAPALAVEAPPTGPKLDAVMAEANKAYDRGDFEDAKLLAGRLLAAYPGNVRMLRIMVSASCIDGDTTVAQTHFAKLPPADQEQMTIRCARYGVTFSDKP